MNHFRLGSHMRFLLLKERFSKYVNLRILDVGCNYGEIEKFLAMQNQVHAIDTDKSAIVLAKKITKSANFKLASATDIPYQNNYFDVVLCLSVIEHIKDDKKAISELKRVLKHGGEVILTAPNKNFQLIPSLIGYGIKTINKIFKKKFPVSDRQYVHFGTEGIGHVRQGYSLHQLKEILTGAGFKIQSCWTYWHPPTRIGYLLLVPFIKSGILGEYLAKIFFWPFFLLDKFIKDERGDILIIARKDW